MEEVLSRKRVGAPATDTDCAPKNDCTSTQSEDTLLPIERKPKVIRSSSYKGNKRSTSRVLQRKRGFVGRDALQAALERKTKSEDWLVTQWLQGSDVLDVNEILVNHKHQAVYGLAFAQAVRENGNPHLDPSVVLCSLRQATSIANPFLVRALIDHPKMTAEEAFYNACTWALWDLAAHFAASLDKKSIQVMLLTAIKCSRIDDASVLVQHATPTAIKKALHMAVSNNQLVIARFFLEDGSASRFATSPAILSLVSTTDMVNLLKAAN